MNRLIRVSTPSTNDYAKAHAELTAGCVVVAPEQAGGKGRNGRTFMSKEGGAYFSVIRQDDLPIVECAKYMMAAPLAVVDALASLGIDAKVKYPNDVLVKGRKICGILIETVWRDGKIIRAILGIGVNVNNDVEDVGCPATSIGKELGKPYDVEAFILKVVEYLDEWLSRDRATIAEALRGKLLTLGKRVKTDQGEGIALSLQDDGTLLVRAGERILTIGVGDVVVGEEIC